MAQHDTARPGANRRSWIKAVALTAAVPLAMAIPAAAQQEVDPMEAMRLEFDACIARGVEGSECAALAKATLDAIMNGETLPVTTGAPATEPPPAQGVSGGNQLNSSSGQDGQVSNGGDPAPSGDVTGNTAAEGAPASSTPIPPADGSAPPADGSTAPVEGSAPPADGSTGPAEGAAPPADGTTAPPAEGAAATPPSSTQQPGNMTTTTTTNEEGTTTGSTSSLSGGAQSNDASGTDGGRRRNQD